MVRVIYTWSVPRGRRSDFGSWWHEGTLRIRSRYAGALGSTLLEPVDDPDHLVAVARWRSRADLETFWSDGGGVPFDGAQLTTVAVFEELDDLTLPPTDGEGGR